jgi:hypothetical protein
MVLLLLLPADVVALGLLSLLSQDQEVANAMQMPANATCSRSTDTSATLTPSNKPAAAQAAASPAPGPDAGQGATDSPTVPMRNTVHMGVARGGCCPDMPSALVATFTAMLCTVTLADNTS